MKTADHEKRFLEARFIYERFTKSLVEQDLEQWIELFDENVVFEFPYAPKGFTQRLEGKSALYAYIKELPGKLQLTTFTEPFIHLTLDPNVFIIEFGIEKGHAVESGRPYPQSYISVIKTNGLSDNKIIHYKDYWNPIVALGTLSDEATIQNVFRSKE